MTARLWNYVTPGTGQTTDAATVTTIASWDISGIDGAIITIEAELIGKSTGNTGTSAIGRRTFKVIAGTLTALGTLAILAPFDGDLSSLSIMTLDATGTTIRLRVNGIAATTIDWMGWLKAASTPYTG